MSMPERYCPSCAAVVAFEQPPCAEDHEECPEWACTLCGVALLAGVLEPPGDAISPDAAAPGAAARYHAA